MKSSDPDRLYRTFFGFKRRVRVWAGWFCLVFALLAFGAIGYSVEHENAALEQAVEAGLVSPSDFANMDRAVTDEEFEAAYATGAMRISAFQSENSLRDVLLLKAVNTDAGRKMVLGERVGYVAIAGLIVCSLTWFLLVVFRKQPARILLLRKFNDKSVSKPLSNLILSHIAPFGHTMTLSDKFFKKSGWSWFFDLVPRHWAMIPVAPAWWLVRVFFRQFNRAKWGPVWVGSARNYRHLAKRLRDRIPLNFIVSCSSSKEAFMVRTHDDWWQEVIKMKMNSSDVIVVDLSNVTAGTQWELERLEATNMWNRSVFVVQEERYANAIEALKDFAWHSEVPLHTYDDLGDFVESDRYAFRHDMISKIAQTAQSYTS